VGGGVRLEDGVDYSSHIDLLIERLLDDVPPVASLVVIELVPIEHGVCVIVVVFGVRLPHLGGGVLVGGRSVLGYVHHVLGSGLLLVVLEPGV
jgi:hypothetical protein